LLACPVFEIFYGGARGSLKTDGMLGEFAVHSDEHGSNAIGLMVRRERTDLVETYERAKAIYMPLGVKFQDQAHVARWPSGARLRFAYLDRDEDAEHYQGHSYTRVYVEEIGQFADPAPVLKLMATLRSAAGVRVGFRATGNPGGPGHHWVKARYIDPAPLGWKVQRNEYENPWTKQRVMRDRVFIPGKITDHNLLGPEYIANLQMSGNDRLVKAWLEGDWSIIEGAFFTEFSTERHVVEPFKLPGEWARFRAMDWGSARPFSVGWYAIADGEPIERGEIGSAICLPRGCLVKYREWYGAAAPNIGLKLTAEEVADGILEREKGDKIAYGVLDPAAFTADGGPSIAERMCRRKVTFRPADNARVARAGALGGWDMLRARLKGDDSPMIVFFSTCTDTVRTLPALQHDTARAEDVDTDGEDHAADETRYACMSRPWIAPLPAAPEPARHVPTFQEAIDKHIRRRRGEDAED